MKRNVKKKHYNKRTDLTKHIGMSAYIEGNIQVINQRSKHIVNSFKKGKGRKHYRSYKQVYDACLKNVKIRVGSSCFYYNHIWVEVDFRDVKFFEMYRGHRIKASTNIIQYFKGYRGENKIISAESSSYQLTCGVDKLINPKICK